MDQGNKNVISKSNTRNKIAIKKKRTEKGLPGIWKGSKPHSYIETFSLLGIFSLSKKEIKEIIKAIIKLTVKAINTKK